MATTYDVTIYKHPDVKITVIDGVPPPDQTALIDQLRAENAALRSFYDAVVADANARKAADAAHTDGQNILDLAGQVPPPTP